MASATESAGDTSGIPLPSPAQIALSLIVLKSKPADSAVEDYVDQLRANIADGSRTHDGPFYRHLDGAAYWKEAHEKSEAAKAGVLDQLFSLQQQIVTRSMNIGVIELSSLSSSKRKFDETPAAKANSRSKRKANTSKALQSPSADREHPTSDMARADLEDSASQTGSVRLLRAFFSLRSSLQKDLSDPAQVLSTLRITCRAMTATIDTVMAPVKSPSTSRTHDQAEQNERASDVWLALGRSYSSTLEAFDFISTAQKGKHLVGSCIAEMAGAFSSQLVGIESLSTEEDKPQPAGKAKTKITRSWPKDTVAQREEDELGRRTTVWDLTRYLVGTMTCLRLEKHSHCGLFEALISIFLDHLGCKLSLAVFTQDTSSDASELPGILQPTGLLKTSSIKERDSLSLVIEEAPYLVFMLRKIMAFIQEQPGRPDSCRLLPLSSRDLQSGAHENVAQQIRKRMQSTLLRGVFGNEDPNFDDSFRRSPGEGAIEEPELLIPEPGEMTPEWFIGEVWSHLGWDLLSTHISCD